MGGKLLYDLYEYRLARLLRNEELPRHIAVILDGNRRWAKALGSPPAAGHRAGASKIIEFLEWSDEIGVEVVTLWMLSTDNLSRSAEEISQLLDIIVGAVETLTERQRWRLQVVGDLTLFPTEYAERLQRLTAATRGVEGMQVNVAVGYGGRHELVDAIREILVEADSQGKGLAELAEELSDADITAHLYTRGQPDPDLVIRTSGEQRLSGFLLWQSAHSEYYFCDAYWPDFRRVDFLRALRAYCQRERRLGK